MEDVKYKYNLYWILPVACITNGMFIIICCMVIGSDPRTDPGPFFVMLLLCALTGFLALYIMQIISKAFRGVPAIALTREFFIANTLNFQIDWKDITSVAIRGGRTALLGISINRPEQYFDTPLKRVVYKLNKTLTRDDIRINLDFVLGNNQSILEMINAFRKPGGTT